MTDRLAGDRAAGSSALAAAFLGELEHWLERDRSASLPALRADLLRFLRAAQAAQPSMALVHQLAARALVVTDSGLSRGDTPHELRRYLAESCASERSDLAAATLAAAKMAAATVRQNDGWIATLSASGGVAAAVRELKRLGRSPRLLIGEGRPGFEGRDMAAALAADGIPVWLVADAALAMLIPQAAALWIGADAVTETGVLNKIGSFVAALAAREHGVPAYAIAVRKKLLPGATASLAIEEMPPAELWDAPPRGVQPRNVYFEMVPLALLRGVVVEDSVLGASEVGIAASDRELPPELAAALERG